jgi:hypothetical protein
MTNPRDPEGLMPDAGIDGPPVDDDGELPIDREPDARFPGADEDATMTAGDAGSGFGAGVVSSDASEATAGE